LTDFRGRRRRLGLGLATILGLAPRGFFIPHRYAAEAEAPGARACYREIERIFAARTRAFREVIAGLDELAPALEAIAETEREGADSRAPRFGQGWFPRLDAACAYAMVRRLAPRRIVEIGAGHSTRFLARAVADGELDVRITTIDPAPRAALYGLDFEFVRAPVQRANRALFAALEPGDMLFVDSSHVAMPGTDVDVILNRVWPALPQGAVVHFHDVFLPDDYPADWSWRGYNEQLAIAPLISSGGAELLFASHYAATRLADALSGTIIARLPIFEGALDASLWVRKVAGPAA
jgi:predicted O-methyltransferase YrrM